MERTSTQEERKDSVLRTDILDGTPGFGVLFIHDDAGKIYTGMVIVKRAGNCLVVCAGIVSGSGEEIFPARLLYKEEK